MEIYDYFPKPNPCLRYPPFKCSLIDFFSLNFLLASLGLLIHYKTRKGRWWCQGTVNETGIEIKGNLTALLKAANRMQTLVMCIFHCLSTREE